MKFPLPHIHPPQAEHTHTIVLLHGRASDGPEFAEELFSSLTSKNKTLLDCLPNLRWVFPTSRNRWSALFQEEMCSWFDAYSLTNINELQELQIDGLKESVAHILDILDVEIRLLNGKADHVYLGGISQGMATALWTVFCAVGRIDRPIGGILGFCGWLPFANEIEALIARSKDDGASPSKGQIGRLISDFCRDTIGRAQDRQEPAPGNQDDLPILASKILLGHGTDDVWISVELGQQARRVMEEVSGHVGWMQYSGAEGEGHWIKEPEGFDRILEFLEG
ncbi:alpha/beta-hydrolase [Aspergillus heterothallicus]